MRDLSNLEKEANRKPMNFIKGRKTPTPLEELPQAPAPAGGADQLESSFAERDSGVLVDTKLYMSQKCPLATKMADSTRGCVRRNVASRLRQGILFLHSALAGHIWSAGSISALSRTCETEPSPAEMTKDWSTCHMRRG